jgi:hypothetical protein
MYITSVVLLLLAQVAEPQEIVLTGTIADGGGKPVAGSEIVLAEGLPALSDRIRRSETVLRPPAVLRRLQGDINGRFRVGLPPDDLDVQRFRRPLFLWAFGPERSVAVRPIPDDWPPEGEPVRLTLAPSDSVRFRVLDPDERPVTGVRLMPARIRGVDVPVDVGVRFQVETDADGRGTLAAGAADELEVIRLISAPFGVQHLRATRPDAEVVRTLRLLPVGRLIGRIVAGDLEAVRGLTVRVLTDPDRSADLAEIGGWASVVTDDQGRFTVPALAAGTLAVSVDPRWDLPWRSRPVSRSRVQPATTTELTIPFVAAARLSGVVHETASGLPLAGVGVAVVMDAETPLARTDAEGRFSAYLAPGMVYSYAVGLPRGYFSPSNNALGQPLPEGLEELTARPLGLSKGVEVQGEVIDAEGRPAPGAEILGHYDLRNGRPRRVHAVTDRAGRFRIDGVPSDTTLYLSVSHDRGTTAAPESFMSGRGAITLKINPENFVALYGRVKDPAGRPLVGATVRVQGRKRGVADLPIEERMIAFDNEGRTALHTDVNGQFRTVRRLRPDLEYRVEVEADGYAAAGTEWVKPDEPRHRFLPTLVLQPLELPRTLVGRVVDRQGRPVARAGVYPSGGRAAGVRSVTGADGRFRLSGIHRQAAFLVVEGDGLAFEGHRIEPGNATIELRVRRAGDPPGPPLHTLPPPLPRDEEKAVARRLIETDLTPPAGKDVNSEILLIRALARLDPARALALIDGMTAPDYREQLRSIGATALIGESPLQASAFAEALTIEWMRSRFYREASDGLPKTDRVHKLGLLDSALEHAKIEPDSARKLDELGMIGYRLLDLGETERGTQVLREGQRLAGTMPKLMVVRGVFAAKLARIDAQAAFGLAEGYSDQNDERFKGGVALALADRDAERSERAFQQLKNQALRDLKIIRAVGRMAAIDSIRARRFAEALQRPSDQALALFSMARGLTASDPKAAKAVIEDTLIRLTKLVEDGGDAQSARACLIAAAILPLAEQLDPALLERCFWTAIALQPPPPAGAGAAGLYEQRISSLAFTLARYDRTVARRLLAPVANRVRSLDYTRRSWARNVFAAAAVIDPNWAVALADSLPDDTPGSDLRAKSSMRLVIAEVLSHGGPDRWDQFDREQVGYYLAPARHHDSKDDER